MDLLAAIKTTHSLKKFVEEDLVDLLIGINFSAASNALQDVALAVDKRSAYWSAINHLQSTEEGFKRQLKTARRHDAAKGYIYISALKATIFRYIGEDKLIGKCLNESLAVLADHNRYTQSQQISDMFAWWNPTNWIGFIKFMNSDFGRAARSFDAESFWKEMGFPGNNFYFLSMDYDEQGLG